MSPAIHVRRNATLSKAIPTVGGEGPFELSHPGIDPITAVRVLISPDGTSVETQANALLTDELLRKLQSDTPIQDLVESLQSEVLSISQNLGRARDFVLRLLQQEVQSLDLFPAEDLGFASSSLMWREPDGDWRPVRGGLLLGAISVTPVLKLDTQRHEHLQRLLDSGESPLLAMVHLYLAQASSSKRAAWIHATVAAELAIKEVLGRLHPVLATVLAEVPSPPIHKLYGTVLEALTGARSSFVTDLQKGAERRNFLIHRVGEHQIEAQECIDYIQIVHQAISHLIDLARKHRGSAEPGASAARP